MAIATFFLVLIAAAVLAHFMRRAIEKRLTLQKDSLHAFDAESGGPVTDVDAAPADGCAGSMVLGFMALEDTPDAAASSEIRDKVPLKAGSAARQKVVRNEGGPTSLTRPLLASDRSDGN